MNKKLSSTNKIGAVKAKREALSWEERISICERWKSSGLSKTCFCQRNNLVFSTFCAWCDRLWPKKENAGQLCQVAVVEHEETHETPMILIEVNFQNCVSAKMHLHGHQVISLIRELAHATTTLR